MKKVLISIVALVATLSFTSCVRIADAGSQRMTQHDNEVVSDTGRTIQKGVQPINEAKDDMVDAVKDVME
jgi:hypothetical protein